MLTAEKARELLIYDPDTGIITRKIRTSNRIKTGEVAGWRDTTGYRRLSILGTLYLEHRIAWLIITGGWPPEQIDHINGICDDNRWINLRAVSIDENMRNKAMQKNNTSGVMGVHWNTSQSKWFASIRGHGKSRHLGTFNSLLDAAAARKSAEARYGFHKNHGTNRGE